MNKIKLCFIADQVYKSGGIERVLSHRINHLIDAGYEVHLITNENKKNKPYFLYHSCMIHHDLSANLNKKISLFSPINLLLVPTYFLKLREVISSIKPDIIVMTNYGYEYYLIPLFSKNSYLIKEYHSSFVKSKSLIGVLKNFYNKFYDTHVFLSEEEKKISHIENSVVIPNPIVDMGNKPLKLVERQKAILAVGRIVSIKGFERLIESWSRVANKYPDWRLEIYGDGEPCYIKSLNDLISQKGIIANTVIYPSVSQISDEMLDSCIYAMTSLTECFPMVLLEAMQSKMAIIAFDCPTGPRNIIKHKKTGLLVADNDIDEFTVQLELLMTCKKLAQKLAYDAYADVQQYDIEIVMKKWDMLLEKGLDK